MSVSQVTPHTADAPAGRQKSRRPDSRPRASGATGRAIAIGLALIPLNAFWVVRLERVLFGPYPSTISLFANVVFALFALVGLNAVLRRAAPGIAFRQGELLTIYTMLAISTGLAGLDGVGILSQMMPHGAWFATPSNNWAAFLGTFPRWLIVTDPEALRGHYLGNSTFYTAHTLRVWATPILCWTVFVLLLMTVANCINVLVRRQWADRERLTFPILWLPVAMTDEGGSSPFFRSRLMWSGFALAGGLGLWNGIAFLYPSLPTLPIGVTDLHPLLTAKPWNAIDWLPVTLYPLAIGLGYLLPTDLLFSCWFFFLFWRGQVVVSNAMAWDATQDFPFIREQGFGAVIGLFLYYVWSGRRTYAAIWRSALRGDPSHGEALSDRAALGAMAVASAGLLLFCVLAGASLWVAAAFFALYLPMMVVVTRIRAELGAPVHDFHFMGPDSMIPRALSTTPLRAGDLSFFTFTFAITRAHRSDTMPIGLEGLQMARMRSMDSRRMFAAIMLATFVGTLSAFWAFEHQAYTLGAGAKFNQGYGHAQEAFERTASWVARTQDRTPNRMAVTAMAVGLLTTWALMLLRLRFFGFPLHPIGYAISSSWAIHLVWLPLFIAWVLKSLTMRYGGLRAYRGLLPFFLGLVLGDCVVGSVWALLSLLFNMRMYNFFGQ